MDLTKIIQESLVAFQIPDRIESVEEYIHHFNFQIEPAEVKFIAKIDFNDRTPVVIRMTKEEHIPHETIVKQTLFSETLRGFGIPTSKKYLSDEGFVKQILVEGQLLSVIVEDYVGASIKELSQDLLYEIGALLGQMHQVSKRNNLTLGTTGYVFNLLGKNDVVRMDKLLELSKQFGVAEDEVKQIEVLYKKDIDKISYGLRSLHKYAVQGDINCSNLSYSNQQLSIFDYNIACDEYLVIQTILEGLLLTYEEEYFDHSTYAERFQTFLDGYNSKRAFSDLEKQLYPIIYRVAHLLWFTKIHLKENSIERLLVANQMTLARQKILSILDEYQSLVN